MTDTATVTKVGVRKNKAMSTSRFIIHMLVVGVAYLLGHLQAPDSIKRWISVGLCVFVLLFDNFRFRLRVLAGMNQWLKDRGTLRPKEFGKPSNATHLALIIGLPLLCQVPIWVLVPPVVSFAAGDTFAREIPKRFFPDAPKVWSGGDKTWIGYWSYTLAGNLFGVLSILWLNDHFPLYPKEYSRLLLSLGAIISTFTGAAMELWCEKIPEQHSSYLDDNLVVPVFTGLVFTSIVFVGAMM